MPNTVAWSPAGVPSVSPIYTPPPNPPIAVPFDGDFSKFFTGPSAWWQPSVSLTYATTLLATGTGTPPVITLTTPPLVKCPIRIEVVAGGILGAWTGKISYDSPRAGGGTFTQNFTSAATVNLTGAGFGGVISIAAGTAAADHVWAACASQIGDTTGRNHPMVQNTAGKQPLVTKAGGKLAVEWDGVDDESLSDLYQLDTAVNGPGFLWLIGRRKTWQGAGRCIYFGIPFLRSGATEPQETVFLGQTVTTPLTDTLYLLEVECNYSATTDYMRAGSAAPVFGSNGNNGVVAGVYFGSQGGSSYSNYELSAGGILCTRPPDTQLADARAQALTYFSGLAA